MMKKALFVLCVGIFVLFAVVFHGQAYGHPKEASLTGSGDNWIASFGGQFYESFNSVAQTNDGGYITVGSTGSFGGGGGDIWVVKFNAEGSIDWQKTYGGSANERPAYIGQTDEGEYFVAGITHSFSLDGTGDIWLIKLTAEGNVIWQELVEVDFYNEVISAQITSDGGLIIAFQDSVVHILADGAMLWQKGIGNYYSIDYVEETNGGWFIASGSNRLMGFDPNGNLAWSKIFDSESDIHIHTVRQVEDGYILSGQINFLQQGNSVSQIWAARLSSDTSMIWQKSYGLADQTLESTITRVVPMSDGSFILLASQSDSITGNSLLKLDANGNLLWQKTYEGFLLNDVIETTEGEIIVVGYYRSATNYYGDASFLKLDANGQVSPCGIILEANPSVVNTQETLSDFSITLSTLTLQISETAISPVDTTVNPNYLCQSGVFIPPEINNLWTVPGLPQVILVSLTNPNSSSPLPPQYTLNGGSTWKTITSGPYNSFIQGIVYRSDPQFPVRLFAHDVNLQSLYRSGDWGQTWVLSAYAHSVDISPKDSQVMYTTFNIPDDPCGPVLCPGGGQIFQSLDGGVNWSLYLSTESVYYFNITPSPVTALDGYYMVSISSSPYWQRFGSSTYLTFPVDSIALDATDANRIYGVTYDFTSGQTSPDGGITWIPWASSPPLACVQLMAHPTKTNTLYLRCAAGLFRSNNGGDNWTQITTTQGDALAPHLGNPGQILWSQDGCLLASNDDGDSWTILKCYNSFPYNNYLPLIRR